MLHSPLRHSVSRSASVRVASITLLGLSCFAPGALGQLVYDQDSPVTIFDTVLAPDGFIIRNGASPGFYAGGSLTAGDGTNSYIGSTDDSYPHLAASALRVFESSASAYNLYVGMGGIRGGRIVIGGFPPGSTVEATFTVTNNLYLGYASHGQMDLRGNSLTTTKNTYIGYGSGGTGDVYLTEGAVWNNSGVFNLGASGASQISIEEGSSLTTTGGNVSLGSNAAVATITVSGAGSSWNAATIFLKNGSITVDSGAMLSTTSWIDLGNSTGTGSITVTGSGSTWTSNGEVGVGRFSEGNVTISDGATWNTRYTAIGNNGNTGTVLVTGQSTTWVNGGLIGVGTHGPGFLTVSDGATVQTESFLVGELSTGSAVLTGTNTSLTAQTTGVNQNGSSLTISAGATLLSTEESRIGLFEKVAVTAVVTGAGSSWTTPLMKIGTSGVATLTVSDGGTLKADSLILGEHDTGMGILNIGAAAGAAAAAAGVVDAPVISGGTGTGILQFNTAGTTYFTRDGTATGEGVNTAGNLSLVVTAGTHIALGDLEHTGGTTINGGVLEARGAISGDIANEGTFRFNGSEASVTDGTISGAGDIELVGSGPVTFSGVNTYTGRLELAPWTTLRLENNAAASTRPIYVRNATIDYADGLNISNRVHLLTGGGDPDKVAVRLNVDSGTATQGEIFDGSLDSRVEKTGAGTLVLTTPNTIKGGVILSGGVLSFGASTSSLGSPSDGTLTFNGGTLRYTGEASATYGTPRPTSITAHGGTLDVTDAGSTFSLAGALSGTGTFTKTGAGTVYMAGTHSAYTGAIVVGQGRFQVSATTTTWAANAFSVASGGELYLPSRSSGSYELGSLSGAGDVTLVANSGVVTKLTVGANNTDSTFAGAIATTGAGTGSLTKVGTGTLTLNGVNTYTGATSINAGKLVVNGSLASASVTVQSGAALGGSGSFGGLVTIGAGATLAPGNSPGTITFTEGLSLAGGSVLDFELGTLSDLIVVSGGSLLGPEAGVVTINLADSGGFKVGLYTLIDATGADMPLGVGATDFALGLTIAGYDYSLDLVDSQLLLTVVSHAIPEPPTAAALAGLGALGAVALRRRRRVG